MSTDVCGRLDGHSVDQRSEAHVGATAGQSNLAYEQIKRAIIAGDLTTGQVISESQLAALCNVSRTPIREAVQRLEMEQFLVRGERGLTVPDPTPGDIYEIYETRGILETANARLAAERRTNLDLANITHLTADARAITDRSIAAITTANLEFARAIWRASHNQSLAETLERLGTPHVRFGGSSTLSMPGQWDKVLAHHSAMLDAIEVRDADRAAELASAHIADVRDVRIRMWHDRNRGVTADLGSVATPV
ncbi:GntR family transcriptional regulator [Naasia lichenicola]|uniref:GntR family transcriptional regulator n=1 Tax=Naasia lichenicola TaxID=2565933 RepID=A0A4S4FTK3_9MICO|nr:GntR family transcriptional regulator [Naasia lichenicola]THG33302.1 GntR family transcriptional regulator [Naasia lichenicola]